MEITSEGELQNHLESQTLFQTENVDSNLNMLCYKEGTTTLFVLSASLNRPVVG